MNKVLIVLGFLLISTNGFTQQTGSLEGLVEDEQGVPLQGIKVLITGQNIGAITNEQGKFSLKKLAAATYNIEVSGLGYTTKEVHITINATEVLTKKIVLEMAPIEIEEVEILAETEGRALERSANTVKIIETQEIKLKSADLGEIMAQTEGVNVQRAGGLGSNIRFSLNGLSGDQIRFFYADVPLNFTPYAFGIANVPVNMIDRVEIYKGVVPIQFGADALGGAVNLVPPKANLGWGGSASYQLGSFGTHRATASISYADQNTGLFVIAGGFYDYTDNDYKIDVAIGETRPDGIPTGRLAPATVRRFHDGYRAYGTNLRIGIRNKKWANELSVEGYYGDYDNEIQNSQAPGLVDRPSLGIEKAVAGSPLGEVRFTSFSRGINLHYNVSLAEKWELDLKAGYNDNERVSIDTSKNLYNWFGEVIRLQNQPGELGEEDHLFTFSESAFARKQLTYTLSDKHAFKLSIAPTYSYRTGDDLLIDGAFDPALDDGYLFDLVTGLEYTADLLDGRLQNMAFIKNYRQNIRIESLDASVEGVQIDERSVSNVGAGNGLKYDWSSRFSTKLSYEFAYRLPRQDEIFGDGQLILENLQLRPESSHNLNLQGSYSNKVGAASEWQIQGNFFLRRIDDLIFLLVNANDLGSFQNVWSATSQGLEFSGRWKDFIKGFTLAANSTYQQYINTSDSGPFVDFRGDRIPNTPYFFANGSAEYQLENVLKKEDNLSIFWNTRFVNSFFVGWESAGLQQFKAEVPNQTIHRAGVSYQFAIKGIQNALTLEIQNLTNAKVFDLFGVQRPGRAFYLKSTIQF